MLLHMITASVELFSVITLAYMILLVIRRLLEILTVLSSWVVSLITLRRIHFER
jgi:hypothetical protein